MFCANCGAPNPDDARFCQRCGKPVGGVAAAPPTAEPPPHAPAAATTSPSPSAAAPPRPPAVAIPPGRESAEFWKSVWQVYLAIAILVGLIAFIQLIRHPPPSFSRAVAQGVRPENAPNILYYSIGKGLFWPYGLVKEVMIEHRSFKDWLLNRYDPWERKYPPTKFLGFRRSRRPRASRSVDVESVVPL